MASKIDFILAAINDTQATIRGTDVKVGALLAGMLLPISSLGRITAHFSNLATILDHWIAVFVALIFYSTWIITIILLVRTISAIDNPSRHIDKSSDITGSFYGGGLFKIGFLDAAFNRSEIKASKDVLRFSTEYPKNEGAMISELSFEHMKLIYIRDVKLLRLRFSLKTALAWMLIGISVYVVSKIG